MRITIAAIGKLSVNSPEYDLILQYKKRLPWQVEIRELQVKKPLPPEPLKTEEAALLLGAVPAGAKVIALDERGKAVSSPEFAAILKNWQEGGARQVAFLIGGAAGLDANIRHKADLTLSFGAMTWPHMLVRAMLCEQLYRAYTIHTGHPYHKE